MIAGSDDWTEMECLTTCLHEYGVITGCEFLLGEGCYKHTQEIDRGRGTGFHVCWPFFKCGKINIF